MPKVSEGHKEEVRTRILEAVESVWRERGSYDLTTRDILARAGVSNGTLYHYFDGKDALAAAVAERLAIRNVEALHSIGILDEAVPIAQRLGRLLAALSLRFPGSLLPELRARAIHDESVRKGLRRFDQLLEKTVLPFIQRAQDEGILDPQVSPGVIGEILRVFFEGLIAKANSRTMTEAHDDVAGQFVDLFLTSLVPAGRREEVRRALRSAAVPRRRRSGSAQ